MFVAYAYATKHLPPSRYQRWFWGEEAATVRPPATLPMAMTLGGTLDGPSDKRLGLVLGPIAMEWGGGWEAHQWPCWFGREALVGPVTKTGSYTGPGCALSENFKLSLLLFCCVQNSKVQLLLQLGIGQQMWLSEQMFSVQMGVAVKPPGCPCDHTPILLSSSTTVSFIFSFFPPLPHCLTL